MKRKWRIFLLASGKNIIFEFLIFGIVDSLPIWKMKRKWRIFLLIGKNIILEVLVLRIISWIFFQYGEKKENGVYFC